MTVVFAHMVGNILIVSHWVVCRSMVEIWGFYHAYCGENWPCCNIMRVDFSKMEDAPYSSKVYPLYRLDGCVLVNIWRLVNSRWLPGKIQDNFVELNKSILLYCQYMWYFFFCRYVKLIAYDWHCYNITWKLLNKCVSLNRINIFDEI